MRKKIVAGNWKMNLNIEEASSLLNEIDDLVDELNDVSLIVAPPSLYIHLIDDMKNVSAASQNNSRNTNGAYTGEISAAMLKEMNVSYGIIGHSERREYQNELDQEIAEKFERLSENSICPILCVGESLEERNNGSYVAKVSGQIENVLKHGNNANQDFVLAYEPIWAIGTGETASPEQAQEMHAAIREKLQTIIGDRANSISILYGGSCKPNNAKELFSQKDIDGGLIGGASLKADSFIQIAKSF